MTAPSLDRPEWKVRCAATRKNGEPCKKWAIRGGSVCEMHGGRAPQVKEAAQRRIEEARASVVNLLPEATTRLREMLHSSSDSVAIRAIKEILDRSGLATRSETDIRIEQVGSDGMSIDDEINCLLSQMTRIPVDDDEVVDGQIVYDPDDIEDAEVVPDPLPVLDGTPADELPSAEVINLWD